MQRAISISPAGADCERKEGKKNPFLIRICSFLLLLVLCLNLVPPAHAYSIVHIQASIDLATWEILTGVVRDEVGITACSPEWKRMEESDLTTLSNYAYNSLDLIDADKVASRDKKVANNGQNILAGIAQNAGFFEEDKRVLSFPTKQKSRNSSDSTDMESAMAANNAIVFDLNQAFKVYCEREGIAKKPDATAMLTAIKDFMNSTSPSGDFIEYYASASGNEKTKYRWKTEKYKNSSEMITWSMLIVEAFNNFSLEGDEAVDADNVFSSNPNQLTKAIVGFFGNALNDLRSILGLWSMDELMFNEGWRSGGYVGGIFPTSWEPTIWALFMIAPDYKETRFKKKEDADAIEAATKSKAPGTVAGTKNETKSVPAPTLYSLTELQKAANRMLKFKPDKTLSIAQKLYEDGLLTYPRTESRFLPTDMIPEIPAHISPLTSVPELAAVASGIGQAEIDRMLKGKYVDDAGITDHHAIIPTDQTPNWASLSKDEQAVYSLVGKAFLAIFLPPYQSTVSTILVNVGGHLFKAKGNVEIDPGYTVLYPKKAKKEAKLPVCQKGDKADLVKSSVTKGTTKPPDRYTPDTILSAMKNAGQDLPDSAMRSTLREAEGLGTPATRADILVKLESREYVKLEKNAYYALDKGIHLIEEVGDRPFSSAALTAEWEGKLQEVEKGKYTGNFRQEMEAFVTDETAYLLGSLKGTYRMTVGKCPFCGGDVVDLGKFYSCKNRKKDDLNACSFAFNKVIAGYTLTEKDIEDLLAGGETEAHDFSYKGKKWTAPLSADKEKGVKFQSQFTEAPVIGKCPFCGGNVRKYQNSIACENNKKDNPSSCKFWIPVPVSGHNPTEQDVQALLSGRETEPHEFHNKEKSWTAMLSASKEKGIVFKYPERKAVGKCPICGGAVVEIGSAYLCENQKRDDPNSCKFWFAKKIGGSIISTEEAVQLLQGKETAPRMVKTKTGKDWKVSFFISDEGKLQLKDQEARKQIGICPKCGKPVVASENNFYCSDKPACQWSMSRVVKGTALKDEDVAALLKGERTRMMSFTWSSGKQGNAALRLQNGELKWFFDN